MFPYYYLSNRLLTDRSLWTLRMASANRGAMESCCTFSERLDSGMGIVSEKTSFSISDLAIRSIAGPESTECVAKAYTVRHPRSFNPAAALQIVPAVSMISSTRIAVFVE